MSLESFYKYNNKIKTVDEIVKIIGPFPRDKKVTICHGVFDIVHPGHIRHMLYAKSKTDILIISITADQHIVKANMRPYVPEELRALNLTVFEFVDYVIVDKNPTPIENLKKIQPDYFAKGFEYNKNGIIDKTKQEIEALKSYGGEVLFTPGDVVYSSSHLLETSPPNIVYEKLMILMDKENITFNDLRETLNKMKKVRVHVVGDTIVDSYTNCTMIGGMTKTPTMSVRLDNRKDYVGGAAVVAKHIKSACNEVILSTVMGNDDLKDFVLKDLQQNDIKDNVIIDPIRPTTNKNAIVVSDYRLLKIDTLDNRLISNNILEKLCKNIKETEVDLVVFSDFRHGIFNKKTIPMLTEAIPDGVFKVADSQVASRWGNILEFNGGFDLITPNEREARFALADQDSVVRPLGVELYRRANCKTLVLKLGDRGVIVFCDPEVESPRSFFSLDSFANNIVDPVGAGDALLAYTSLAMVVSGNEKIASILGSIAAGIECECDGNIPISPLNILEKIDEIEKSLTFNNDKKNIKKYAIS